MLNKFLLLTLLVVTCSTSLSAQKKNKDVEVIEFGESDDSSSPSNKTGYIIKTNPLSYLFGWQFVEVEKPITDFLSVQGGVGITFASISTDLYAELLSETSNIDNCNSEVYFNDYCDDIFDTDIRKQKTGLVLNSYIRLFFDDDAPDGGYFAITTRYSTKNYDVQDIVQGASSLIRTDDTQKEKERNIDIVGNYGYQVLYDNLTAEYFVGIGIRVSRQNRQDIGQDQTGRYYSSIEPLEFVNYRFELGARIGFQL